MGSFVFVVKAFLLTFLLLFLFKITDKLSRLNSVFERAADKRLGGIREDKLARILPSCSSSSKDKYEFLFPTSSTSLFTSKDSKKSNNNVEVRVVSRGPFLAMFAHESVSFLNTLAQNEKTEREKHRRRMKAKKKQKKKAEQRQPYAQQEDGSVNRQRAHSLPSPPASVENKQQQSALADFGFSCCDKKKPMPQSRNPETEKGQKQPERMSMTSSNTTKQSKKSKREKKEKKKSKNKSRDGSKKTSSVGKLTKSIRKKYFADCTNSQNTVANTDVPPEDYKANSNIKSELTAVGYENMTASESSYSSHSTQGGHYGDREQEEPRIIHHCNTMPDSQDLHHYHQQHHYPPSDVYSSPPSSSINQISSIDIGTYPFPQHAAQVPLSEFKEMSMPSSNSNGTPMDEINCISYSYSSSSESEIGNDNKRSNNSRSSRRNRNHTNTTTAATAAAPFWQQQKHTTYEDYLKKLNCGKHKAAYSDDEGEDEMENDSKMECVLLHNVVSFFEKLFPQSQQRRTAAVVDISPTSSSFSSSLRRRRRNDFFDPNPQQTILYYTESTTSESSSSYPPSNEMMMRNDHTRSSSISHSNRNRRHQQQQQQHGSSSRQRQRQRQRREKRSHQTYNFPQNLTTMRTPGTTAISSMRSNSRA